jgi:ankyrin repeat protein
MLLERGALTDVHGSGGLTALHYAVYNNNDQFVRLLLEHGADVNIRDNYGGTPSELASKEGYHEIVELLSEYRAESVNK